MYVYPVMHQPNTHTRQICRFEAGEIIIISRLQIYDNVENIRDNNMENKI